MSDKLLAQLYIQIGLAGGKNCRAVIALPFQPCTRVLCSQWPGNSGNSRGQGIVAEWFWWSRKNDAYHPSVRPL